MSYWKFNKRRHINPPYRVKMGGAAYSEGDETPIIPVEEDMRFEGDHMYITYCSGTKDTSEGTMPSIDRYKSKRITDVSNYAKEDGKRFAILSGVFGLLKREDKIPYYDHLMTVEDLPKIVSIVSKQLLTFAPTKVTFYVDKARANGVMPTYVESMKQACKMANVPFEIAYWE